MRFACLEHPGTPGNWQPLAFPPVSTLLEGPAKSVFSEQLSLCQLRSERLFLLLSACLNKMSLWLFLLQSILIITCPHTSIFSTACRVCYLPGTVRAFLELPLQWTMAFSVGNEIMEKVSRSRPCITFYPALAACQTLFSLLIISFNILVFS